METQELIQAANIVPGMKIQIAGEDYTVISAFIEYRTNKVALDLQKSDDDAARFIALETPRFYQLAVTRARK